MIAARDTATGVAKPIHIGSGDGVYLPPNPAGAAADGSRRDAPGGFLFLRGIFLPCFLAALLDSPARLCYRSHAFTGLP